MRWHKDFENLINAFSLIAKEYEHWSLNIFGEGEERKNLESLISNNDLIEKVTLKGLVTREELALELQRAKIFVISSVTEGLPKVLLEAMSACCSCIATDVGDCRRVLNNNGIVVEKADPYLLYLALKELIDDPVMLEKNAIQSSIEASKFSWESYKDLHKEIYFSSVGMEGN